jgi:hypothetical protein
VEGDGTASFIRARICERVQRQNLGGFTRLEFGYLDVQQLCF